MHLHPPLCKSWKDMGTASSGEASTTNTGSMSGDAHRPNTLQRRISITQILQQHNSPCSPSISACCTRPDQALCTYPQRLLSSSALQGSDLFVERGECLLTSMASCSTFKMTLPGQSLHSRSLMDGHCCHQAWCSNSTPAQPPAA